MHLVAPPAVVSTIKSLPHIYTYLFIYLYLKKRPEAQNLICLTGPPDRPVPGSLGSQEARSQGPRVPVSLGSQEARSQGPRVPVSQGPRVPGVPRGPVPGPQGPMGSHGVLYWACPKKIFDSEIPGSARKNQ